MDGLLHATPQTRFRYALAVFTVVVLLGTIGFQLIEGWSLLDSAYMVLITVSTVGFGEVNPLSPPGRIFTIFLLLFGVGAASYTAFLAAEVLVARQMGVWFKGDRMSSKIENLKDHVILCGYGRVVSPYRTGAQRMAITTLQPSVVDLMVIGTDDADPSALRLEEVVVTGGSDFLGKSLRKIGFKQRFGLMVAAIKRPGSDALKSPESDVKICEGDILRVIGPADKLEPLAEAAAGMVVA